MKKRLGGPTSWLTGQAVVRLCHHNGNIETCSTAASLAAADYQELNLFPAKSR